MTQSGHFNRTTMRFPMSEVTAESSTMLSRRFSGQFRWLFAELLIVVLGVFIALAIDEWREDIEESARETEYLAQLIRDLQTTEGLMQETIRTAPDSQAAARILLRGFESEQHPDLDQTRDLMASMRFFGYPSPKVSTAEGMVSTGEFRLLQDRSIRSKVTDYLAFARDDHMSGVIDRSERNRELLFQFYILAQSYGISPGQYRGQYSVSSEPDISAFFGDPNAYIYLAGYIENRDILLGSYAEALAEETRNLREALEKYASSK